MLEQYGVYFVTLGTMLEGDTVAVTAGVLAHQGTLAFWPTVFAAALGGWLSDLGIFSFGRLFRHHPRVLRALAHPRAQRMTRRLLRRPMLLAALFRFIPGTRTIAPLALSTATQIPFPVYAGLTGVACCLWALVAVTVGKDIALIFGLIWGDVRNPSVILAVAMLAVIGLTIWSILRVRRRLRRARALRE